jgi:hypothetical protein
MKSSKKRWGVVWGAILGLTTCLFGCTQSAADLSEPITFAQHGINFKHPKNWTIQAEALMPEVTFLTIETGGAAVLFVTVQPAQDAPDLLTYANDFSNSNSLDNAVIKMKRSNVKLDPSNENRATQSTSVNLVGVDVPHQVEYRRSVSSDAQNQRVAFLVWQTAVDDASKTAQGAVMVFDSFKFTP